MKKTILIVEDEEHLRFLYEEELKEEGYEVLKACNGKEALFQLNPDIDKIKERGGIKKLQTSGCLWG